MKLKKQQLIPTSSPEEARAIPIVADAAIATQAIGHGRLVPLIILDTSNRPDMDEVVNAQQHVLNGEVTVQWGELRKRQDHFALILCFQPPIERTAIIEFNISRQGSLVEQIFQAGAIYLQSGKVGDRLKHDLDRPKMLVDLGETGAKKFWDKIYFADLVKKMRRRGLKKSEARVRAQEYLKVLREIGSIRA